MGLMSNEYEVLLVVDISVISLNLLMLSLENVIFDI
jgi:hypothetical protein